MRQPVPRTDTASQNPLTYEDGDSGMIIHSATDPYMMTNILRPGKSLFAPPLHLHLFQTEYFRVQSGTAVFYLRPSSKDPGRTVVPVGETIKIPRRVYHRFENGSETEQLVISLRLDPQRFDTEERFFRNFFGYLEDCRRAKLEPSFFQLLRLLYENDTPLALPVPDWCPEWIACWMSAAFLFIAGVLVGEWLLGYKGNYPEHYRKRTE